MANITKNSLQWHTAVKTFFSILIAGLVALAVPAYLNFIHISPDTTLDITELVIGYGLTLCLILILAGFYAYRCYISLSAPLDSIEQISHSLPLLSSKKYDEARQEFHSIKVDHNQEIEELKAALFHLTDLLEQLDKDVRQRTQQFQTKNNELLAERDFVKSLLDTAQLIILTIDRNFNITLFNDYGEKITGFTEAEILHSEVARMFAPGNWTEAQTCFNELLSANLHIAQQESELIDKAGHIKQISWLHSRVENNNKNAVILSVGLDMTEKKEAEKRIVWMAEHDPLTDLCNRRKFIEEFEKSLRTAIRYNHNNTLLFLDLDQFKDINDSSGHRAGDELLKLVAKTLKDATRFTDLVARLGSDEFAILMPESDDAGAKTLAQKIMTELAKIQLEYGSLKHKISTSIGIVHYPLHEATTHELLGFADLAMYKAKSKGKSSFHVFSIDDETRKQLETRVFWKNQIEQALENQLFVLHYQPILDLNTNTVRHYEVLIRMRDPETNELRLPGKFIEIAEEVGLIQSIDHYVIMQGISKLAALQKKGLKVQLAINLSGAVIDAPALLSLLKKLIKKFEVNPEGLIFEVTETAVVTNLRQAKLMMTAIKALGCRFSLDDFGVGFSSFNYMRELPIDIIKIDGIFVKDLDKNADDQLFVKALVDIAKGLGKKTIAEFVENRDVLTILRTYGVDFAQGYYIGRPDAAILDGIEWEPPNE